jgi:tetraacyldisaccharide-1-P 4'-kinase
MMVAQSPPAEHQGLLLLTGKDVTKIKPLLTEFWTPTTIAVELTVKKDDKQGKVIVIGHYS